MHTMFQGMARSSSAKSADTLSDSIAVRPRACFANSPIAPLAARLMRSLTTENGSSQPPCSPVPSHRHELATDARRSSSTHPAVRGTAQNSLTRRSNLGIPPRRLGTTTQSTSFIAIIPEPTTAALLALGLATIDTRPGRTTNQNRYPRCEADAQTANHPTAKASPQRLPQTFVRGIRRRSGDSRAADRRTTRERGKPTSWGFSRKKREGASRKDTALSDGEGVPNESSWGPKSATRAGRPAQRISGRPAQRRRDRPARRK